MTSRPIVPVQAMGEEAAMGEGKGKHHKKNGAAQGKNRRALGDIGNLVPANPLAEGKPLQQISRPITRGFHAQLLANAQTSAAAAEINKKLACVNLDGGEKAVGVEKRAPKREIKEKKKSSKPVEVIDISPDTIQEVKGKEEEKAKEAVAKDEKVENKKDTEKSSRRKVPTLTSVLTARSKAACGLSRKPEDVVDIDAADTGDELAVSEYVEELYLFYKENENECRPRDYMSSQPEINETMRAILIDWLIAIHYKFELMPETLYLAINIVDRFLSKESVPRKELQLLGMGAMFTASKYEEIWAPEVNNFVCVADQAYTNVQVLAMEKTILGKLEWTLTVPTHYVFLARFVKASQSDEKLKNMAYFLAELGLMNYGVTIQCSPSMVAASAVYAARCALNVAPLWNKTLEFHTGYSEPQVTGCAKSLVFLYMKVKHDKLQGVFKKYSKPESGAVALIPPPRALLEGGGGHGGSSESD